MNLFIWFCWMWLFILILLGSDVSAVLPGLVRTQKGSTSSFLHSVEFAVHWEYKTVVNTPFAGL